jgi:hypothetical protein
MIETPKALRLPLRIRRYPDQPRHLLSAARHTLIPRQPERAAIERLLRPLREHILDVLLPRTPQALARGFGADDLRQDRLDDVRLGDALVLGPVRGVQGQPRGGDVLGVRLREGRQRALGLYF